MIGSRFALVLVALAAPSVAAQSQEFILDEGPGDWVRANAPEPGTDAALIADARRELAEGRHERAKAMISAWIEANERTDNPHLPEAYLLRADALLADDSEYRALYDLETIIKDFPESEQFAVAVEREYDIGVRYLNGLRRKFLGVRIESGYSTGEELLIRVQERMPGSRLAEIAALTLADSYYDKRELGLAADMYAIFLANYPRSEHREHAMLRQIDCNVARFKGPRYDGSSLLQARLLVEQYEREYPSSAARSGFTEGLTTWIDESGALQRLETARWYLRRDDEPSARLVLRRLVRQHPESAAAQEAVRMMTERGWVVPAAAPVASAPESPSEGAP